MKKGATYQGNQSQSSPRTSSLDSGASLKDLSALNNGQPQPQNDGLEEGWVAETPELAPLPRSLHMSENPSRKEQCEVFCEFFTHSLASLSKRNYRAELKELSTLAAPVALGLLEGGVDGASAFTTVGTIADGVSAQLDHRVAEVTANGVMPTIAVMGAAIAFLKKYLERYDREHPYPHELPEKIRRAKQIIALWTAFSHDIRMASFVLPLFFFVVTEFIEWWDNLGSRAEVDISDGAAAAIMAACFMLSTLEGIKAYYDQVNKDHPGVERQGFSLFCSRIATHSKMRRFLAGLDGAGTVHWFVMAIEGIFGASESMTEKLIRYVLTAFGGIASWAGHGSLKDANRWYYKVLDWSLLAIKAISLSLSTYTVFQDREFWGQRTLSTQLYFWCVAFPLYVLSFGTLFHQAYKKYTQPPAHPQAPDAQAPNPINGERTSLLAPPQVAPAALGAASPLMHHNYGAASPASSDNDVRAAALSSTSPEMRFALPPASSSSSSNNFSSALPIEYQRQAAHERNRERNSP